MRVDVHVFAIGGINRFSATRTPLKAPYMYPTSYRDFQTHHTRKYHPSRSLDRLTQSVFLTFISSRSEPNTPTQLSSFLTDMAPKRKRSVAEGMLLP